MKKNKGLGKLFAGLAIGAGLGVLFAPKEGKETRKMLKLKLDELIERARGIDSKEVKENIEAKVFQIKEELADLDKEKVLKIAKKKAQNIQDLAQNLVDYTIEKGTPILEKTAESVRQMAIKSTKEILSKLEDADKKEK